MGLLVPHRKPRLPPHSVALEIKQTVWYQGQGPCYVVSCLLPSNPMYIFALRFTLRMKSGLALNSLHLLTSSHFLVLKAQWKKLP